MQFEMESFSFFKKNLSCTFTFILWNVNFVRVLIKISTCTVSWEKKKKIRHFYTFWSWMTYPVLYLNIWIGVSLIKATELWVGGLMMKIKTILASHTSWNTDVCIQRLSIFCSRKEKVKWQHQQNTLGQRSKELLSKWMCMFKKLQNANFTWYSPDF